MKKRKSATTDILRAGGRCALLRDCRWWTALEGLLAGLLL